MTFAKTTTVSVGKTVDDIKKKLKDFGAEKFMNVETNDFIMVAFVIKDKSIKMTIPISLSISKNSTQKEIKKFEQISRTRWRNLLMVIKAKIASIEMNIETFEQAFLPYFVVRGNQTIGEKIIPALEDKSIKNNLLEYFQ